MLQVASCEEARIEIPAIYPSCVRSLVASCVDA